MREALEYLSRPDETLGRTDDGHIVINPDADPRNADWLRIGCRLSTSRTIVTDLGGDVVVETANGYLTDALAEGWANGPAVRISKISPDEPK